MACPSDSSSVLAKQEGYAIWVDCSKKSQEILYLVGHDKRGALFAVGRFIRLASFTSRSLFFPSNTSIATVPAYPLRGHQLSYGNMNNSCDAWDINDYEQYVRDLMVFETNSIELCPHIDSESGFEGKHMKYTLEEMTAMLCELGAKYDLDIWLFLPLDEDVTDPVESQQALDLRKSLFQCCPRISHIMVPGGDPGHTHPSVLMPWLARLAEVLRSIHPAAGLWVSNQGFDTEQNQCFFEYLQQEKPRWLTGVVYGPWTRMRIEEERLHVPPQFQIRFYPDITHALRCQYPLAQWDRAFALTHGREPICPRPTDMVTIFTRSLPSTDGFVAYSEGVHDDFNKAAASLLGWDPTIPFPKLLSEYAHAFFGTEFEEEVSKGLELLEITWRGPISNKEHIEKTRRLWEKIAATTENRPPSAWRSQLYLYRAIYDSFLQKKSEFDRVQEKKVLATVESKRHEGAKQAALAGVQALEEARNTPLPRSILCDMAELHRLGLDLFRKIGYQLSASPPYLAMNPERGATLDFLDRPLNNTLWLEQQFTEILNMKSAEEQEQRLTQIMSWDTVAPDSFYDDLGNVTNQPHLVIQSTYSEDPSYVKSTQNEYMNGLDHNTMKFLTARLSWLDQAQTLYGTPLRMHYENLATDAQYKVRVTYAGRFKPTMELWADGQYKVHDALPQPDPTWPTEFNIPKEATQDAELDLEWRLVWGRGCQVAEVWLIKI